MKPLSSVPTLSDSCSSLPAGMDKEVIFPQAGRIVEVISGSNTLNKVATPQTNTKLSHYLPVLVPLKHIPEPTQSQSNLPGAEKGPWSQARVPNLLFNKIPAIVLGFVATSAVCRDHVG